MSFADLVHRAEHDLEGVLVPEGAPSDTREAEAIAKAAEGVAVTLDPELEPLFGAIGSLGSHVEETLTEMAGLLGTLKTKLAERGTAPVGLPSPPAAAADTTPDASEPSSTGASTEETVSEPSTTEGGDSTSAETDAAEPSSTEPTAGESSEPAPSEATPTEPERPSPPPLAV